MSLVDRHADRIDKAIIRKMAFNRIPDMGVDPLVHQANIMRDDVDCRFCNTDGMVTETRWVMLTKVNDIDVMRDASPTKLVCCPECAGTRKRIIKVSEMANAGKTLLKKTDPDLAAHRLIGDAAKLPLVRRLYNEDSIKRVTGGAQMSDQFEKTRAMIEEAKPFDEPFQTLQMTDDADAIEDEIDYAEIIAKQNEAGGTPMFAPSSDDLPQVSRRKHPPADTAHIEEPNPFNPTQKAEEEPDDDIQVTWPT